MGRIEVSGRAYRSPERPSVVVCVENSGLGYKEGVQQAIKSFTNIKTYSLPWPA